VFARIPPEAVNAMHARDWKFYTGVVTADESRLMCSWDTTEQDVDAFANDLASVLKKRK
jgi:threonine aldolase